MNFVYYMLIPSRDAFLRMASSMSCTAYIVSTPWSADPGILVGHLRTQHRVVHRDCLMRL